MNRDELFATEFAGAVVPPSLSLELAIGDDVVSHVGLYWRTLVINGAEVNVAGVGGVVTAPGFRSRGLATALMRAAHTVAADHGLGLAALFCNEWAYKELYGQLGYSLVIDGGSRARWPPNLALHALQDNAIPYGATIEEPSERW